VTLVQRHFAIVRKPEAVALDTVSRTRVHTYEHNNTNTRAHKHKAEHRRTNI